jgi:filamentous hemagglutinin family protein
LFLILDNCFKKKKNQMKLKSSCIILLSINSLSASAEVTLDGTLGRGGALPGPDYLIGADLGRQHGGNLFHSFQGFNLNHSESATFSGPNSVSNIISRVTGGNPSQIDGLIRSTIPNADMYFLNPYGIMFGPNARLDVQGSFHASTADYLRLGNGGRFDAYNPSDSILTVAPIEAFGFLEFPAPISVRGAGEVGEDYVGEDYVGGLRVPAGKMLSLISGEIKTTGTFFQKPAKTARNGMDITRFPLLTAPAGQINLAGVASAGEVTIGKGFLDVSSFTKLANITIDDRSRLETSGKGGGNIFIRGGDIFLRHSQLISRTLGTQNGGVVSLWGQNIFTEGYPKEYSTEYALGHYMIDTITLGKGYGSNIDIQATHNFSAQNSLFYAQSGDRFDARRWFFVEGLGDGGDISVEAENISFNEVWINTETVGKGNRGGGITFQATDSIHLSSSVFMSGDYPQHNQESDNLFMQAKSIDLESTTIASWSGAKHRITIQAEQLNLSKHSNIFKWLSNGSISTDKIIVEAGELSITDGSAIYISATDSSKVPGISIDANKIILTGVADFNSDPEISPFSTGIPAYIRTTLENPKPDNNGEMSGGNISIETKELSLTDGGLIANQILETSKGNVTGGKINIRVDGPLILSGVNIHGETEDGFGSGIYSIVTGSQSGQGADIEIQADTLHIENGAMIKSHSESCATAGHISLHIQETAKISGDSADISLEEPLYRQRDYLQKHFPPQHNESVSGIYMNYEGQGKSGTPGGQITLSAKKLILTDRGTISTDSQNEMQAGQIEITVERLELDNSATISSSSRLPNIYANEVAKANSGLLVNGDILEVNDMGQGKSGRFVYIGGQLIRTPSIYTLANESALSELAEQYDLLVGDIAELRNEQTGELTNFIYVSTYLPIGGQEWVRMDDQISVVLNNMSELGPFLGFSKEIPYREGQLIQLNDAGKGKPGIFVYSTDLRATGMTAIATRVNNFTFVNLTELQQFTKQYDLHDGYIATVSSAGNTERFVYENNDWLKLNLFHTVADMTATHTLIQGQPGFIAQQNFDGQLRQVIYTDRQWIPLNNIYHVNNLAERDQLLVQNGDLVKIEDIGNGRHDAFVYVDNQWISQTRGGDAGKITIKVDSSQLIGKSQINTESVSGGGGNIILNVDNLVFLSDSQVSTSVQEGVSHGGNLTLNSEFFILENGKIIARANEGQGGNIRIVADQFIASPDSLVSASSRLGLDGNVEIDSPDENVAEGMLTLSSDTVDTSTMTNKSCEAMSYEEYENRSSFDSYPIAGSSPSPFDLQPSRLSFQSTKIAPTTSRKQSKKMTNPHPRQMALVTVCKPSMVQSKTQAVKRSRVIPEEQLF